MPAEYSFVLAGKYGVGKSSLFKRLKTGAVPEGAVEGCSRTTRTLSDDDSGLDSYIYETQLNGKQVKVTLWDTGGQERFDSMTANYYRNAHAIILVYALDDEATLYALNEWVIDAKKVNRLGDRLTFASWGTKSDLPTTQKVVKQDVVESMMELYHVPKHLNCEVTVFDTSINEAMAALVENVDRVFNHTDTIEEFRDIDHLIVDMNKTSTPATTKRKCCHITF